ncbi:FAD-dependent oxidoreductase [Arthrobacter sp. NPDC080031]|uniref:FAD-dependent oxidoreductase n=1 Tax=Arthrobacter sp. NPDC080031 TaxID=3155918 RepID=UPI00344C02BB
MSPGCEPRGPWDLIVVGFGAAGSAAALRAAQLGGRVLIIEKQAKDRHTPSTYLSGGVIMGVKDVEAATEYLDACSGGLIPLSVSRAWAESASTIKEWLREIGVDLELAEFGQGEHEEIPGHDAVVCYWNAENAAYTSHVRSKSFTTSEAATGWFTSAGPPRMGGERLFEELRDCVLRNPAIEVWYGAPALELIHDDGRVTGVVVEKDGEPLALASYRGVVLACGGFAFNDELKANYLPANPVYFYGNPGNTGDGVRMAQAVGADLWHMNQMVGRGVAHVEMPDGEELTYSISIGPPGYVITDRYGKRFMNEYAQARSRHDVYLSLFDYSLEHLERSRIPAYWFFDQRRFTTRPLGGRAVGRDGLRPWSQDNRKELELGWIVSGETIEEVARKAGMSDPAEAARSVAAYNEACRSGTDAQGRPVETLIPLDSGPYYCVRLYPGGSNTCGGPRRDHEARVLDTNGAPIPGLYSAGELGEAVGLLYPADGGNLSDGLCFGRLAAESAFAVAEVMAE